MIDVICTILFKAEFLQRGFCPQVLTSTVNDNTTAAAKATIKDTTDCRKTLDQFVFGNRQNAIFI